MTTLKEIVKYLRNLAPSEYSLNAKDSRVEIGNQTEEGQSRTTINRVLVAVYPSARIVTKASQEKSNLLITHRPLFPFAIDRLSGLDLIRVRLLSKNYISCYSMNSPWIAARNGLTDALTTILKLKQRKSFEVEGDYSARIPIGRVCEPTETTNHSGFVNYVAEKIGAEHVIFTGDLDLEVGNVIVAAGDCFDIPEILEAKKHDYQTIVTGNLTPEIRLLAKEEDMNIIEIPGFLTEEPGMKQLRGQLSLEFPELKVEYAETFATSQILQPYTKTRIK